MEEVFREYKMLSKASYDKKNEDRVHHGERNVIGLSE